MKLTLATILLVGATAACEKTPDNAKAPEAKGDKTSPAPMAEKKAAPIPAPPAETSPDPENGDFTLDEATKGLGGAGKLHAEIATDQGKIDCELFDADAPRTVASFVGLARGVRPWRDAATGEWVTGKPFYDGLAFHRVIPDFMIQGGDQISRNYEDPRAGSGGPGYKLPDERKETIKFDQPGRLAMANSGHPTTGGSQFFVTESANPRLDRAPGYVIFGQCGPIDVVKAIARVPRNSRDKPDKAVTMKVTISRR